MSDEAIILSNLYSATDGPNWLDSTGWTLGEPCGTTVWFGVKCQSGKVKSIALSTNGLKGTLIDELQSLNYLESLELDHNPELSGSIPPAMFEAPNLASLNVAGCALSGILPMDVGLAKSLVILDLSENKFSGTLPSEIGNLGNLQELILKAASSLSPMFNGRLPTELGRLSNMVRINLSNNGFKGTIPTELAKMTGLLYGFDLGYNLLSGKIPSELGRLTALQNSFVLQRNQLTGWVPSELGTGLRFLEADFDLASNKLSGTLPSTLGLMTNMTGYFDVTNNNFCGDIPPEVLALPITNPDDLRYTDGNEFGTSCCLDTANQNVKCVPSHPPTPVPSPKPIAAPTVASTTRPSGVPSSAISAAPSNVPSEAPSISPATSPTINPSSLLNSPSRLPSPEPSSAPTANPTSILSVMPAAVVTPTTIPSTAPKHLPTSAVAPRPSSQPAQLSPTQAPTPPSTNQMSSPWTGAVAIAMYSGVGVAILILCIILVYKQRKRWEMKETFDSTGLTTYRVSSLNDTIMPVFPLKAKKKKPQAEDSHSFPLLTNEVIPASPRLDAAEVAGVEEAGRRGGLTLADIAKSSPLNLIPSMQRDSEELFKW